LARDQEAFALAAIIYGVGVAAVQAVGPTFILSMAAAAFAIWLLVNAFGLWPVEREKQAEEAREEALPEGAGAPPISSTASPSIPTSRPLACSG
jgi:hypothetical protein